MSKDRYFRTILFDLYDTLIWLDSLRSTAWRSRLIAAAGVEAERFNPAWRRTVDDRMLGKGNGLAAHLTETLTELGVNVSPDLISRLVDMERQRLEECVHLYPATRPVLAELRRRGYRLGLVSNISDGASVPISSLGLDQLFDDLILSHEVGILKPDPAIFTLACQRLGTSLEETMFVADGGFGELDASHSLGIFSVLVEQDNQSKDYGASTRYDLKIQDLTELLALLSPVEEQDA